MSRATLRTLIVFVVVSVIVFTLPAFVNDFRAQQFSSTARWYSTRRSMLAVGVSARGAKSSTRSRQWKNRAVAGSVTSSNNGRMNIEYGSMQ